MSSLRFPLFALQIYNSVIDCLLENLLIFTSWLTDPMNISSRQNSVLDEHSAVTCGTELSVAEDVNQVKELGRTLLLAYSQVGNPSQLACILNVSHDVNVPSCLAYCRMLRKVLSIATVICTSHSR